MVGALRGLRVLAVDDHDAYREILREHLTGWGFDVDVAGGGAEALRKLKAAANEGRPYRVAVVDLMMPGMGGEAVARAVAADPQLHGKTTLLMLRSMDSLFDRDAMRQAGFSACLTKPIRQSQLFDAIMDAVAGDDTRLAAEPTATDSRPLSATAAATAAAGSRRRLAGVRVLLAEDNAVNQEVARELLLDVGCEVEVVGNGLLAVRAVEEQLGRPRLDVVLMDCQMPEMDGFEAALRIRAIEQQSNKTGQSARLPIIALTANAVEGDRLRCLEAGMDGYVTKPVDLDNLIEAIRSVLSSQPKSPGAPIAIDPATTPGAAVGKTAEIPAGTRETRPAATVATIGHPPIDIDSLLLRFQGNAAMAERLLGKFQNQLGDQISSLRESLARRDGEGFTRLAHNIKGASANMSAERVRDAARDLEQLGEAADFNAAAACVEKLAEEVRECLAFIPGAVTQIREMGLAPTASDLRS
jgi:CheY-like chemotaxis protein/HPt (histidine-containing phosphotransfer) domain-containing protein